MQSIPELFGSLVFNDAVMRERLPQSVYEELKASVRENRPLSLETANVIADAMKNWAIEKGATHYTHWFQPMTGVTAEKHDSFIEPDKEGGILLKFSGKELIKGEPDASSFPSGGLRSTFEARGYTNWDPTSYAFVKDSALCIPTAFCSYGGAALDKKTPLLRSMHAVSEQALRILRLFGSKTAGVTTTVGPEQEYFLIDRKYFDARKDLIFTGRTLFGAKPPKGQEMDDHYFGTIKPRVSAFMRELDEELWKLGILAKTKHNEAAPAQHELAPIFSTTNIATDHNQLTMEMMKKVAAKHGLACLLHEKPFAGINGSGKHNNWSMSTDEGVNLFEPGQSPEENAQFLLFLCAVIKGVDEYQDLLRVCAASAGNDHRLGANEAPPAIISIFLGDELTAILESIETGLPYDKRTKTRMRIGVDFMPEFARDTTDRNRTSPFAFTGNKFEFRMVGSTFSTAGPNTYLNTIVAEELSQFADELERATDFKHALDALIKRTIKEHKRIIFNGNGYEEAWVREAEARGLLNLPSTADALPYLIVDKNLRLFEKFGVFSNEELHARYEILLDNYSKVINIEALTMIDMTKRDIIPAVVAFNKKVTEAAIAKAQLFMAGEAEPESTLARRLSEHNAALYQNVETLETVLAGSKATQGELERARYFHEQVLPAMAAVRKVADELETITSEKYWPFPTYDKLLFSV